MKNEKRKTKNERSAFGVDTADSDFDSTRPDNEPLKVWRSISDISDPFLEARKMD